MTKTKYLRQLQGLILRHVLYRGEVHADDVLTTLPVPEGVHPNIVGTAFSHLDAAGLIEATGFERSRRERRHRGISRTWRTGDARGCRTYLLALATTGDDIGAETAHAV